jgi:hypothetical protein
MAEGSRSGGFLNKKVILICHPGGIYAVVCNIYPDNDTASNVIPEGFTPLLETAAPTTA